MNAIEKLREQTDLIRTSTNGLKVVDAWALAARLIGRMPVDQAEASRVLKEKDAEGLDALVRGLEHPAPKVSAKASEPSAEVSHEEMAAAMQAFKRRLKAMRLADESRLGGRYTSGGRVSKIDAIEPPSQYPPEVWKALAREGRLKDTGGGFYAEP